MANDVVSLETDDIVSKVAAFVAPAAGIVALALESGAYDVVIRQQAAILLWWFIALASIAGILPRTAPALSGVVAMCALLALGTWTALSLGWTSSSDRTLTEVARVGAHLGVVVLVATTLGASTWRLAIGGAAAAAAVVCAVALLSRLAPGTFGSDDVAQAFASNRLSRPLAYWNAVGAWAGMTASLCLGLSAHARSLAARAAANAGVPLAITVSYLTYSRASLAGTLFGLVLVLLLSVNRWTVAIHAVVGLVGGAVCVVLVRSAPAIAQATGTKGGAQVGLVVVVACLLCAAAGVLTGAYKLDRVRLPLGVARAASATAVLAIVIAAIALVPSAWDQFTTNYRYSGATQSDPAARLANLNGSRYEIWRAALSDFESHPWTGAGAGSFEFVWNQRGSTGEFIKDGHSLYIESLSELGVPGLLSVLVLLGAVIAAVVQALRRSVSNSERGAIAASAGAIGAFFLGAAADWLWESTAVAVLALVLLGSLIAASGRPAHRLRWGVRVPVATVATLVCLLQLPGLVSTSEVRESQAAVSASDLRAAIRHADQAIDAQPWSSAGFVQRALVREIAGDFDAAAADLDEAISREPRNWRYPLLLARVEAERGNAASAIREYRTARRLRPLGKFFTTPG